MLPPLAPVHTLLCATAAAAVSCQVVVRTASRSYRVSQMAGLLRDVGDTLLVRGGTDWMQHLLFHNDIC